MKNYIFSLLTHLARGDTRDSVLLASVGRSGTTWLGNILSSLKGYKLLFEPLRPENPSEYEARYRHRPYIDSCEQSPRLRQALEDAFTGRITQSYKWDFKSDGRTGMLLEHLLNRKVVVKSTRCLRILPWIHRNFDLKGTIILIRHPCAVISSMLRSEGWEYKKLSEDGVSSFKQAVAHQAPEEVIDRFGSAIVEATTNAEILAHMWSLDYHIALRHHRRTKGQFTRLVTYEELVRHGKKIVKSLCKYLGEEPNEEMMSQLNQASRTASGEFSPTKMSGQLQKWKAQLSEETIESILSVVRFYDIGLYDADMMPTTYE